MVLKNGILEFSNCVISSRIKAGELNRNHSKKVIPAVRRKDIYSANSNEFTARLPKIKLQMAGLREPPMGQSPHWRKQF
jgi:hypothetical protein